MSYRFILFLSIITLIVSCKNEKEEIEIAMKEYDRLILNVDADSIANTFLINGEMGEVGKTKVIGRDSIRALLKTFSHFKVLSNKSNTTSIEIKEDSAKQKGTFHQTVIVNKDTLRAEGEFFATWVKQRNDKWLLKRMMTKSKS